MSNFWRQAGLNYIKYSEVCAKVVRNCLKPELRADALKSRGDPTIIKATKWEGGKPVAGLGDSGGAK